MLYTWDQYYYASNVLLAELTDGGTFHERAQFFMQQWICGYGELARPPCPLPCHSVDHHLTLIQQFVCLDAAINIYNARRWMDRKAFEEEQHAEIN